jgi:small subunit ribosomal protein S17
MSNQPERGVRKTRVGRVLSTKMEKTVVVGVDRTYAHKLYGKTVTRTKKYYAHDEDGLAGRGDLVRLAETRPVSKTKRWRVVEVVRKSDEEVD